MATELTAEIEELRALLTQAKTPGNVRDLTALLVQKQQQQQQQSEAMEVEVEVASPAPVKAKVEPKSSSSTAVVDDVATFTEISRFGWEDDGYGKSKVSVLVMSGVDGVGDLPEGSVTCSFTKTSFDLKVRASMLIWSLLEVLIVCVDAGRSWGSTGRTSGWSSLSWRRRSCPRRARSGSRRTA